MIDANQCDKSRQFQFGKHGVSPTWRARRTISGGLRPLRMVDQS
jgi:hypothetical protein